MSTGEGWYGNQTTGGVQCPVCRITYPLGVIHTCGGSLPVGNLPALSFTPQGWECPKCGRVNAPFVQLGVNMLWSSYSSHTDQIGNGISAMPSMHVATTAWVALSLSALSPKLRGPAWAYWLAIFIGSFVLGWHYFLDGVVATVGAVGCWTLAHRLITRERNTIRRDKLAAVI